MKTTILVNLWISFGIRRLPDELLCDQRCVSFFADQKKAIAIGKVIMNLISYLEFDRASQM